MTLPTCREVSVGCTDQMSVAWSDPPRKSLNPSHNGIYRFQVLGDRETDVQTHSSPCFSRAFPSVLFLKADHTPRSRDKEEKENIGPTLQISDTVYISVCVCV